MEKWVTIDKKDVNELLGNDYNFVWEKIHEDAETKGINLLQMDWELSEEYRWLLDGDGWQSVMSVTNKEDKSDLSREFELRKQKLYDIIDNHQPPLPKKEDVFTIPSDEYVYYKPDDKLRWRFAIAAWGLKYPDKKGCGDFTVYVIPDPKRQDVNIEFLWNGERLKKYVFYFVYQDEDGINEVKTQTDNRPLCDDDGELIFDRIWRCDNPVEVGKEFHIRTEDGKEFSFVVEEGKSMYTFELTKYFDVEISVLQDGAPATNRKCNLVGIGDSTQYTDDSGMIKIQFPLEGDGKGQPKNPQPELTVYCSGKKQSQTPVEDALLKYQFEFVTPPPPPPEPEFVTVSSWDVGDFYAPDLPVIVKTKIKGKVEMKFDSEGLLSIPKEWFTDGERVKIWTPRKVMKEYAKHHDCHVDKPKKHVENQ